MAECVGDSGVVTLHPDMHSYANFITLLAGSHGSVVVIPPSFNHIQESAALLARNDPLRIWLSSFFFFFILAYYFASLTSLQLADVSPHAGEKKKGET